MRFSDLVSSQKSFGLKKTDVIIVIPFYQNYDALFKHLRLLSKQTTQDFNAILVLNVVSDEKRIADFIEKSEFGFGIIVSKRKEDTGSTGGFFTGEKFAIENGYQEVVLADDDCMPEDPNLIEQLLESKKSSRPIASRVKLMINDSEWVEGLSLHMYSRIGRELLISRGLHFVPLYIGADDAEFSKRIALDGKNPRSPAWASHPYTHTIFVDFVRSLLYRINHMLFVGLAWNKSIFLQNFALLCPIYVIFGSDTVSRGGLHILSSVLSFRFGKPALDAFRERISGFRDAGNFPNVVSLVKGKQFTLDIKGGIKERWRAARYMFRKDVLLEPVPNDIILLSMLLSRQTWISSKKGAYLMSDNSDPMMHLLRFVALGLVIPPLLLLGLVSIPINLARKPKTLGYGLD
jgi:glycosyltransferase involved in cell wall biosynthesis